MDNNEIVTCRYCGKENRRGGQMMEDKSAGVYAFTCFACALEQYPELFPDKWALYSHLFHRAGREHDPSYEPAPSGHTPEDLEVIKRTGVFLGVYGQLLKDLEARGVTLKEFEAYLAERGLFLTPACIYEVMEVFEELKDTHPRRR